MSTHPAGLVVVEEEEEEVVTASLRPTQAPIRPRWAATQALDSKAAILA